MASGRSGQLVVTGAKDALTSPSRAQHVHCSPATESAYFLQHRFEDTALVIFQQHVKRLKEVSPGHYTPLPTDDPVPSLQLLHSKGLGSSRAGPSFQPDLDPTVIDPDHPSGGSGVSSHRASSPGSSGAKASLQNDSFSSADKTPEDRSGHGGGEVEENGVSDPEDPQDGLTSAADAVSFSDSSSVTSSAPDTDAAEEDHVPGTTLESPLQGEVGEEDLQESVDRVRTDSSSERDSPGNVPEAVKVLSAESGPVESAAPAQEESGGASSPPQSPRDFSSVGEPPEFVEPSSLEEPQSPNRLPSLHSEPQSAEEHPSAKEPTSQGEPHSPEEPLSPVSVSADFGDAHDSSDEEVQITHL